MMNSSKMSSFVRSSIIMRVLYIGCIEKLAILLANLITVDAGSLIM